MGEHLTFLAGFSVVTLPLAVLAAVAAYFLGCINGAILISKHYLHEDVRTRGSGNAGLTNFYRNYGPKYAALVLALDALKMVAAIMITCLLINWEPEARLWGALFCVLGHIFPVTYKFKGGKGVLSGAALLFMLDLRIGLICLGVFVILVALTRFVSLGSVAASVLAPIVFQLIFPGHWFGLLLIILTALLLILSHRSNIVRLLTGKENKFSFKRQEGSK